MTFSRKNSARIVVAVALAFLLGQAVTQPLLYVTQLYIFTDEVSLVGIIDGLWTSGEKSLAALILVIGVIAPFAKCFMLAFSELKPRTKQAHFFKLLNVFSSLDAFVVALTIFYVKMSGLSTAETRIGLIWLIAFILLSKVAEFVFVRQHHRSSQD